MFIHTHTQAYRPVQQREWRGRVRERGWGSRLCHNLCVCTCVSISLSHTHSRTYTHTHTCTSFLLGGIGELNSKRQPNFFVLDKGESTN